MNFVYCFSNISLTQRVLLYLEKTLKRSVESVTVIFLNDFWVVRIKLKATIDAGLLAHCRAVLNENGFPYQLSPQLEPVIQSLDAGCDALAAMNKHRIAIISHGHPTTEELEHFRAQFLAGLGYCPSSLV